MLRKKSLQFGISKQFKLTESYTSLILGFIVVIIVAILIISFVKNRITTEKSVTQETSSVSTEEETKSTVLPVSYTVVAGDDLWGISEKFYKSGYNWTDIAKENNLENPGLITAGMKLTIPNAVPKIVTSDIMKAEQNNINGKITQDSYTVKKGDYLWDIAIRAYGDGYRWTDIAKENNLENPSLIFSENVLKLPR